MMGERLSGEDLDRLRRAAQEVGAQRTIIGRLKVEHDIYDVIAVAHSPWGENVGLEEARAAYIAAACPETVLRLVDEVQEAREDEGVYRVWRRRCMEAETRIEELEAELEDQNRRRCEFIDDHNRRMRIKDERIADLEAELKSCNETIDRLENIGLSIEGQAHDREAQLAEMRRELREARYGGAFQTNPYVYLHHIEGIVDRYAIPTKQLNEDVDPCSE